MASREAAQQALVYYFRMLFKEANIHWSSDNEAEIEGIVTDILDAAKNEAKGYER